MRRPASQDRLRSARVPVMQAADLGNGALLQGVGAQSVRRRLVLDVTDDIQLFLEKSDRCLDRLQTS